MISSRVLRVFQNELILKSPSPSRHLRNCIPRKSSHATIIFNRSCVSCESPSIASNVAKATTIPPTPAADHRQLGIEQELFTTSPYSPGSPLFLPKGARMFKALTEFLSAQYSHFGFEEVITPTIYKKSLWERSGHWENYAEDMYSVTGRGASGEAIGGQKGENEEYGLKPMNCPGHCLIFASKLRSYRDLPMRYADFSALHRNEISGALSGLTRVRRFHQDDGHIFCRPSQIEKEISSTLEFVKMVYTTLGLGPYRLALSTRPSDHFIGTKEEWDNAETALKQSLDRSGQQWTINEGDGAFYGPKIDIVLKDSDGKEHQTATIQLDFQLPKRFELEYQAPAPEIEARGETTTDPTLLAKQGPVAPVLIHRAILGSVERMMALLIEHYNGHWPFWLNPSKVIILTVNDSEEVVKYAKMVQQQMSQDTQHNSWPRSRHAIEIPIELDETPRSIRKKISDAKRKRYGAIIVVGNQNVGNNTVNVDLSGIPRNSHFSTNQNILTLLSKDVGLEDGKTLEGQLKTLTMSPSTLRSVFSSLLDLYL
ncbi:threonyl-tRNA synthetase [Ciborinia camelliae]|nr:threonyl-tRNA synthetase [Ciborinia camelliae]